MADLFERRAQLNLERSVQRAQVYRLWTLMFAVTGLGVLAVISQSASVLGARPGAMPWEMALVSFGVLVGAIFYTRKTREKIAAINVQLSELPADDPSNAAVQPQEQPGLPAEGANR